MKMKLRPVFGCVIAILMVIAVNAATATSANDQKVVAALDTQYQAAVRANDAATMDRILADDFILVKGNGTVVTDRVWNRQPDSFF